MDISRYNGASFSWYQFLLVRVSIAKIKFNDQKKLVKEKNYFILYF